MQASFISKWWLLANLFSYPWIALKRNLVIRIIRFLWWYFYLNPHNLHQRCSNIERITIFHIHIINSFDLFLLISNDSHCNLDVFSIGLNKLSLFPSETAYIYYCFLYNITIFFSHFSEVQADLKLRNRKDDNIRAKAICFIHILHIPSDLWSYWFHFSPHFKKTESSKRMKDLQFNIKLFTPKSNRSYMIKKWCWL